MKVRMLLPVNDFRVGDVVDVPEAVAFLWSSTRMSRLVGGEAKETAFLSGLAKQELLKNLKWA
ncbi:hypothetical protein [Lentzea flava]|uniref:Uncharacterized protein n=1 Tax=Lentzea flava TaxID=103732 RepID=A0ABQ2UPN9_9PSEU|nr:hypothetical protein [Lentzea flava]MCP2200013.1 hypothetical protein [Lentzea flava]GGU45536.1 hypothetical protein GCM10010178_42450 [Lentzea flava]